jgi:hypothetical protein
MNTKPHINRNRIWYALAASAIILLGLASRHFPGFFPLALGKYPGDALWALLVFVLLGIVKPSWPTGKAAAIAMTISVLDEVSQIYQAPWINVIRGTAVGHILLGAAFSWLDIIAYAVGILLGALIEVVVFSAKKGR